MIDWRIGKSLILAIAMAYAATSQPLSASAEEHSEERLSVFLQDNCFACHAEGYQEGGFAIDKLVPSRITQHSEPWEAIVRKLAARQMPPRGEPRPDEATYDDIVSLLATPLDQAAAAQPNPGRTETFRRLNRTEYQNAIRDLLALEVDVSEMLPSDEASHGFDNMTVSNLSAVLLERYLSIAQKISRLAIGVRAEQAAEQNYRVRPDITQDVHIPGTPIGTRGGIAVRHHFPQDGEYEVQIRLMRDRNEELEGQPGSYQLEANLDRKRADLLTIERPAVGADDKSVDANLKTRLQVSAGPHDVAVAFMVNQSSLLETVRQPLNVHYNYYRHPRIEPAVHEITIRGPFNGMPPQDTPSRQRVFTCYPEQESDEVACAEKILLTLMRRAYRREVSRGDLEVPMKFFHEGKQSGGFDAGIERALSAVLVNPYFLFRIELDPKDVVPGTAYPVSELELANRLSFFLWSSIPDDELLELAISGQLRNPQVLEAQVKRMLADGRSDSLVKNFAGQWLYLRNLDSFIPDMRLFPDFDENLRQALRQETELFFESIVREDHNVLDMIAADYTFLNERLAKHYEIPHVYGSRFRRVELDEQSHRGGLLRQGSFLCVTSYATRTSPVIRGKWVLENLLGSPPPPPPPDIPALNENTIISSSLSVRERLEQHRADPACAKCHDVIDPVGFALENFDAIGRWRETENGKPVSTTGELPDGSDIEGVAALEEALLQRPELFVQTLTEKLMTFALGRGLEYYDAPAVRRIVQDAREKDYLFSEVILGIVNSVPFQMRMSP
jgi:mono/diheme cytochrome c family protein